MAWRWVMTLVPLGVVLLVVAVQNRAETPPTTNRVVVTIPPLAAIVQELAPETELHVLLPPGTSAHHATLRPSDRQQLDAAGVVIAVGGGLDEWIGLPAKRSWHLIDSLDPQDLITVTESDHHHHHHHHGHDHDHHVAYDPHVWLDPALVASALPALAAALQDIDSAAPTRAQVFAEELLAASAAIQEILQPHQGRAVIQHHDSLRYLLRHGGLQAAGMVFDANIEAQGAQHQHELIQLARAQRTIIISEPQLDPKPAQLLAREAQRPLIMIDPLALPEGTGGYIAWLREMATTLAEACNAR